MATQDGMIQNRCRDKPEKVYYGILFLWSEMNKQAAQEIDKINRKQVLESLSIDDLIDILTDKFGIEPPVTDGSGDRRHYKKSLIRFILACEYEA